MKQLNDATQILDRLFYYMLDWKDNHEAEFFEFTKVNEIMHKSALRDLNHKEFSMLVQIAIDFDLKRIYKK